MKELEMEKERVLKQEQSILSIEQMATDYARFMNDEDGTTDIDFLEGAKSMLPIIKELGEALKMAKNFIPQYEYGQGERFETETYAKIQTTLDKYKQYLDLK